MKPNIDQKHLILVEMARTIYVEGNADPSDIALLRIQESAATEDERRWAYFCAGMNAYQIEAVFAKERMISAKGSA